MLCPKYCRITDGEAGFCRVRRHAEGKLWATTYGRVTSANYDPIEKKPLFHFHPGRSILSLGTLGCNLACLFCQNWEISQEVVPTRELSPEKAVAEAVRISGNLGIAYTYNEPFIWYEYVYDTARLLHDKGLKNVLVTNGYVCEEPLRELLPYLDAMNIDVKATSNKFYSELCQGEAKSVMRTVEIAQAAGCWIELTNLVIPHWNDRDEDFQALADWVASVSPDVPLHFSRYHPDYKLTEPPTPLETLQQAHRIAAEKLRHVYLGNVLVAGGEDTRCPHCDQIVVARHGFTVTQLQVAQGTCKFCGTPLPFVGT